jgi:hypothetical protein
MAELATITSTVSGAVGVLREIGILARKAGNAELNQRLIDLQCRIIELQTQFTELANDNERLKRLNAELTHSAEIEKEMKYEESVFWRLRDGKRIDGPFCPTCWEDARKLIHLTPGATEGTYSCGAGKHGSFRTSEYKVTGPTFLGGRGRREFPF